MPAQKAAVSFLALILLSSVFLGCNGFFVDQNSTVSFPVYAPNTGTSNVSAYKLDPSTGSLTTVTGSPFTSNTGPTAIGTDRSGFFLYAANTGGGTGGGISGWVINADGTLTAMTGSPFNSSNAYAAIAVDPTLRFVFASTNGSNSIQAFTVNTANGVLTASGGLVGTTGTPIRMTEDPSGKFLFAAEGAGGLDVFSIAANTGALTLVQNVAFAGANDVAVDPNTAFAYVADGATGVQAFSINTTTGALTAVGTAVAAGTQPTGIAVSPNAQFVFVANFGSSNVSAFTSSAGVLTEVSGSPFGAGNGPVSVTVDPSSRHVYAANRSANTLSIFSIDTGTPGKLDTVGSISTGTSPNQVLVAPRSQ